MRQSRLSGSVEGVMGNHDSYSDTFVRLPSCNFAPFVVQRFLNVKG